MSDAIKTIDERLRIEAEKAVDSIIGMFKSERSAAYLKALAALHSSGGGKNWKTLLNASELLRDYDRGLTTDEKDDVLLMRKIAIERHHEKLSAGLLKKI